MHADHSVAQAIAHAMIAFLFLYRGLTALSTFDDHLNRFKNLKVPFPHLMLAGGFATMLIGGAMVLLDYHSSIGGAMLIVFTILANLMYHHFWTMRDPRQRQTHTWVFCNNIAVMGGLLMVIAT